MKKFLPILMLALLVLAGCGAKNTPTQNEAETVSGSIADLLAKGQNMKCVFSAEVANASLSGTTYVAGSKARSDFYSKIESMETTSHMINDGEYLYTWTDQAPGMGVKLNLNDMPAEDDTEAQEEFKDNGFNNYNVDYDYKCTDWQVDENMFKTPDGFNFTDFNELMKQLTVPVAAPVYKPKSIINYSEECAKCAEIMSYQSRLLCEQRFGC